MTRLGIFVGEDEWMFFREIYDDLARHYQSEIYQRRIYSTPLLYGRLNRWAFREGVRSVLRRNDICFFEWASELLATATHLPKTCGIVTRLHRWEIYTWAHRINWEAVDRIILVSRAKKREFVASFPDQASKLVVLPESISLKRFVAQSKPFRGDIGILSQLNPRKRVYELILTFYELIRKGNDLHLHIAGGPQAEYGDYFRALQHIVQELDLQGKVTFYGRVTDPWNWYHGIDIFVSNSYSEGLQVAPMEAMASGCYCLAHRWDGAEELLPEENLFYTDRQLQEKILAYCDSPEWEKQRRREEMRAIACETFDIEQTKQRIRQIVEEVAHTTAGGGRTQ